MRSSRSWSSSSPTAGPSLPVDPAFGRPAPLSSYDPIDVSRGVRYRRTCICNQQTVRYLRVQVKVEVRGRRLLMGNQLFDAVRTVMAVREYQDKELPADVVRRIAEAAHLTASAANLQPWHFVVVRERDGLRKLGSMMRTGPYIAGAAAAVIVAYEKASR